MADPKYFNDDAIKAKLSSLNETSEVIVNVAQWLLFNKFVIAPCPCFGELTKLF